MHSYVSDLRHSWRIFRRSPGLAVTAVVALALGIGFTTTMFSILHGGTRSLPVDDPEEIVLVTRTIPARGIQDFDVGPYEFVRWRASLTSFEGLAAFQQYSLTISGDGPADRVATTAMTPNAFALIGVPAARGRVLSPADAEAGAPDVAVISDDLWQARFGGVAGIVGRSVRVNGRPRTIVGVMPPGFGFPVRARIWLPFAANTAASPGDDTQLQVFGRLRDGVTADEATREVALEMTRLADQFPDSYEGQAARVYPFTELETPPEIKRALQLFVAVVSLALLIACANVANLLLARAAARSRDTAIRTALGASRGRIIGLQLAESTVLALVAAGLGLLLATAGIRFFRIASAGILDAWWNDFRIDPTVVVFASLLGLLAATAAGLMPALRASSGGVNALIQQTTSAVAGPRIGRLGRGLVIAQIALACGLLILTATFVLASASMRAVPIPFATNQVLTAQLGVTQADLADPETRRLTLAGLRDRLGAEPGITRVAFVSVFPGRGSGQNTFVVEGDSAGTTRTTGLAIVSPEFFELADLARVRGRTFTWQDDERAPPVAVVNDSWVARHSADREPLGQRLTIGERVFTIVGVVSDLLMQDIEDLDGSGIYLPIVQQRPFVVRAMLSTNGPALEAAPALVRAVTAFDPDMPVIEMAPLHDAIFADKRILDALSVLFFFFGLGATFLAVIGLYAVLAFVITQRTREFGLRMALGADARDIAVLVLRTGGSGLLWGLGVGLLLALAISRVFAAVLERLDPAGPEIFAAIAGIILTGAAIAIWRPLHRAMRLEPVTALRID